MERSEAIQCSVQDSIMHIRIDRPEKRNAITMPMFTSLTAALKDAEQRDDVLCIVVTGNGESFCAGHDLKAFEEWPQQPEDPVPCFLHAIANVRKPLVIAAHGSAAGIGVTWLLHADWVVTSAETTFKLPFVALGIAPEAASSMLLQRAIGLPRAKRLIFGGEAFTGEEAYQWGLVAELSPPEELQERAFERARDFASKDPIILRRIKDWLHPGDEYHQRIDQEVEEINAAVVRRRASKER
ncbi:enoyl-CoA hydratase-related protein [Halomonas denitrificans]|uniref:enoyl-CoA hydratase-related protein n=1 Tax=Halomonas denitrificans TaxID=370769 RepID=UPI001C99BB5C|nr:enoyl-CoA hydratase-related protein [Halomonas denitrificans]MBY5968372.1 enoyl-CoA hydratase/isomerase family protein [Halomonas denitrificans]